MRMDWMIWNTAEPHTTKMKSPSNHSPTGYLSSFCLVLSGTFPEFKSFFAAFSLAVFIRVTAGPGMFAKCNWYEPQKRYNCNSSQTGKSWKIPRKRPIRLILALVLSHHLQGSSILYFFVVSLIIINFVANFFFLLLEYLNGPVLWVGAL